MSGSASGWLYVHDGVRGDNGDVHAIWQVGFYDPDGDWKPVSEHDSPEEAAARVSYLNGGKPDVRPSRPRRTT